MRRRGGEGEGGEEKEIHGGGMKRCRRQIQERKKHTRQCVRTVLRGIRGGRKTNRAKKAVSMRENAEEEPAE